MFVQEREYLLDVKAMKAVRQGARLVDEACGREIGHRACFC